MGQGGGVYNMVQIGGFLVQQMGRGGWGQKRYRLGGGKGGAGGSNKKGRKWGGGVQKKGGFGVHHSGIVALSVSPGNYYCDMNTNLGRRSRSP